MKALALNTSTLPKPSELEQRDIGQISDLIYANPASGYLKFKKSFLNTFDSILNKAKDFIYSESSKTIFWLSDHYHSQINYSRNTRVFRDLTLSSLIKDSKYLESVSSLKPNYIILSLSGSDFLLPERIVHMISDGNEGRLGQSDLFDILTIVLKKSLQRLYFSVHMLSPETQIICQEIKYPKQWVDGLIQYGIVDETERVKAVKQMSMALCKVLRQTAEKYDNFSYEGCDKK